MRRRILDAARLLRGRLWIPVSLACALSAINLFAAVPYHVTGLDVHVSARAGVPGYSELVIPPIGRVRAGSHPTPLQLAATVDNVDLESLQSLIAGGEAPHSIGEQIRQDASRVLVSLAARMALLAAAGGALGAAAASGWKVRRGLAGAILGLATACALAGGTYAAFDERRIANPHYEGIIEAAPWMLGLLDGSLQEAGRAIESLETITRNIRTLFERAEAFEDFSGDGSHVRILHVSDIHDNPEAFDLIEQVIKSFQPDAIVDTGDITDFGTVPEARMVAKRIGALGVPYLFIAGNHDSPEVLRVLSEEAGAILLGAGVTAFRGIRIAGVDDPGGLRADMSPATEAELERARERVAELVAVDGETEGSGARPDILAVHDVRVAEPARDGVPVILCGHDHRLAVLRDAGPTVIDAGTTGGAGVRGLGVEGGVPMSVALLHFKAVEDRGDSEGAPGPLVAVDTIRIPRAKRGFSLERMVVGKSS